LLTKPTGLMNKARYWPSARPAENSPWMPNCHPIRTLACKDTRLPQLLQTLFALNCESID
jgi:hypothetical protein